MLGKLQKLKGRSFDELRERAEQAIAARLERRGIGDSIGEMSDEALIARLLPSTGIKSVAELHAHFVRRPSAEMFAGIRDGSTRAMFATTRWDAERAAVVAEADRVLSGHYELLGYPNLDFGNPIDWHFDPVAKMRAPRDHWSTIPYLNAAAVGDHKVIWEINRHQHFYTLGRAFQATGNAKYVERFVQDISAWMDANPPKNGINWASSLEVSYRAISWMWALEFFRDSAALTPQLFARIMKFAYAHGRHLERYLSTYFSPNTHLTGEALGLLYLGTCLPEFECAARWRERGWKILSEQVLKQLHSDGVYFEQTTYYHRYTVDIFTHAVLLARSNKFPISANVLARLRLGAAALADMTGANGTTPLIGDDDGGHLVRLEDRELEDVRAALVIASVVLNVPDVAAASRAVTEEVLWTLGPEGVAAADRNVASALPYHMSRMHSEGGYAVMRDGWGPDALHAIIDCGPLGTMNCGHGHADTLSANFSVAGHEILVDPGTYSYTTSARDRDWFRHTAMHNSVTVDGEPSSVPAGPFSWRVQTNAVIDSWWTATVSDRLVAHHDGFKRLPSAARHTRTVFFVRGEYWVVVDTIEAKAECTSVTHWHCAIGTHVERVDALNARLTHTANGETATLQLSVAGDVDSFEFGEDWVSRAYGVRTMAPSARISSKGAGTHSIISLIHPLRGNADVEVSTPAVTNGHAIVVRHRDSEDTIIMPFAGETAQTDDLRVRGDFAFVRRDTDEVRMVRKLALFGADAELHAPGVKAITSSALEGVRALSSYDTHGEGKAVISGG